MRLLDIIFASRPLLLMQVWTVYLVALGYHQRLSGDSFTWLDLAIMTALTLIFAAAFLINQVYDEESDRINGKLGFLQSGLITRSQMAIYAILATAAAFAIAAAISWLMVGLVAQVTLLGWLYSAPPARFKDRPIAGLLTNAWAHGCLVTVAVMPEMNINNTGLLGWDNPLFFFLAVASIHMLTTIPDRVGDARTGKRTSAVAFGPRFTAIAAVIFMAAAALVAYRSQHAELFFIAGGTSLMHLLAAVTGSPRMILAGTKMPLLALALLAGYFFPVYFLFIVALLFGTRAYYLKRFSMQYPSPA